MHEIYCEKSFFCPKMLAHCVFFSKFVASKPNFEMKIDVNIPLENPKLKKLLIEFNNAGGRATDDTSATMEAIAEEFVMNAHFLSVMEMSKEPQRGEGNLVQITQGTKLSFPMVSLAEKPFFPIFTDWDELWKWEWLQGKQVKAQILSFDDYASLVLDGDAEGVVINPFSHNFPITRKSIARWKEMKELRTTGHTQHTVQKNERVLIYTPKDYPNELTRTVAEYAETDPRIRALWLQGISGADGKSYLIVVRFKGDRAAVFKAIGDAAAPHLGGQVLDLCPHGSDFAYRAIDGIKPFYRKKQSFWSRLLGR